MELLVRFLLALFWLSSLTSTAKFFWSEFTNGDQLVHFQEQVRRTHIRALCVKGFPQ